jgi:hypothetical protein
LKAAATIVVARTGPPSPKEEAPQEVPPKPSPPETTKPAPALQATEAPSSRFYRIDEVDMPALPDSDWNLDAATLDAAGLSRIVFDVLISRSGEVVGCEVTEPRNLDPTTKRSLEDRIREATLQPAQRQGANVPSVRRIELSVQ